MKAFHVILSADTAGRMWEKQDIIYYPLEVSEYARGYYNIIQLLRLGILAVGYCDVGYSGCWVLRRWVF